MLAKPAGPVRLVHFTPKGHCDESGNGEASVRPAILKAIEEKQPQLAVCGHIHEAWGRNRDRPDQGSSTWAPPAGTSTWTDLGTGPARPPWRANRTRRLPCQVVIRPEGSRSGRPGNPGTFSRDPRPSRNRRSVPAIGGSGSPG